MDYISKFTEIDDVVNNNTNTGWLEVLTTWTRFEGGLCVIPNLIDKMEEVNSQVECSVPNI